MHGRNREREGNLKLECGWCVHCIRVNNVILKWLRSLWEEDQEVAKRSGRDEPMWVVIYIYMVTILEIFLYSCLYHKLPKTICLYHVFSSTKSENKRVEQDLLGVWRWLKQCVHMWVSIKMIKGKNHSKLIENW
jgi:hypothetical protein